MGCEVDQERRRHVLADIGWDRLEAPRVPQERPEQLHAAEHRPGSEAATQQLLLPASYLLGANGEEFPSRPLLLDVRSPGPQVQPAGCVPQRQP